MEGLINSPATLDTGYVIEGSKGLRKSASVDPKVIEKKEAILNKAFQSSYGISKLAAALQEPVKRYMDMKAIGRQLLVTDQKAQGELAYFDLDIDQYVAVTVGKNGASHKVYIGPQRVYVDYMEIGVVAKLPLSEIQWRKYDLLQRSIQRIRLGLGIKEDLIVLNAIDAASTTMNTPVASPAGLDLETLASAFEQLETWPIQGYAIVMNPHAIADMRSWNNTNVDEVARIQLRQTGYLGSIWGANMFVSRLVPVYQSGGHTYSTLYVVGEPNYLGYMPFWADSKVYASNTLDNFMVGFVGWEMFGVSVWNGRAVVKATFLVS